MLKQKHETGTMIETDLQSKMRQANKALFDIIDGLYAKIGEVQERLVGSGGDTGAVEAEILEKTQEIEDAYQPKYTSTQASIKVLQDNIDALHGVIEELKEEEGFKISQLNESYKGKLSKAAKSVNALSEEEYADLQRELSSMIMQYNTFTRSMSGLDPDYAPRPLRIESGLLDPKMPVGKSLKSFRAKEAEVKTSAVETDRDIYRTVGESVMDVANQQPGHEFKAAELTNLVRKSGRKCGIKDVSHVLRELEKDGRVSHNRQKKTWQFVSKSSKKRDHQTV
jgi:uncharacterized protein (UPF0305 family)